MCKVDLKNAEVDQVSEQIDELIGHHPVHKVGVALLHAVMQCSFAEDISQIW